MLVYENESGEPLYLLVVMTLSVNASCISSMIRTSTATP